jgi:hypothetical protein
MLVTDVAEGQLKIRVYIKLFAGYHSNVSNLVIVLRSRWLDISPYPTVIPEFV